MLDQNTDRMWYVIGAVIIGAAIILIVNNAFPQLFASVGETFKGKTEQTTEVVDGIGPKPVDIGQLYPGDVLFWADGMLGYNPNYKNDVSSDFIAVEPGDKYMSPTTFYIYYYDENKEYIGSESRAKGIIWSYVIPGAGSTYMYPTDSASNPNTPAYIRIRYPDYLLTTKPLDDLSLYKMN